MENYTETENNGTHIIIKQIFLNVDPNTYVTWDDLYVWAFYWIFWYYFISVLLRACKRKGLCGCKKDQQPVVAIVADAENVRVVEHSRE